MRILVIGDSIAEGTGASTLSNRWVNQLQRNLDIRDGMPVGATFPFIPASYITSAPDQPVTSSGLTSPLLWGPGWRGLELRDTTALVSFTFTGTSAALVVAQLTTGVLTHRVNGGAWQTYNTNSTSNPPASNMKSVPVAGISGLGTWTVDVKLAAGSAQTVYLFGLETWNGDETAGTRVYDSSHHGWRYSYVNATTNLVARMQATVIWSQPDLIVSAFGTNDMTVNNPSQFQAAVQAFVAAFHAAAPSTPVLMWWPYKSANHTQAVFDTHRQIVADIAAADPLLYMVDMRPTMPDTPGPLYADVLHPNNAGHVVIGGLVADAVNGSITAEVVEGLMVRLDVFVPVMPAGTTMDIVRVEADGSQSPVMGATGVPAVSGVWDDPEVTLGSPVTWRAILPNGSVGPSNTILINVPTPYLSDPYRRIVVPVLMGAEGWNQEIDSRGARVDVAGRRDRVHLWDVEAAPRMSPELITTTPAAAEGFEDIMASGDPFLLRAPCPNVPHGWFIRIGGRTAKRITPRGSGRLHTLADVDQLDGAPRDIRPQGDTLGDLADVVTPDTLGGMANYGLGTLGAWAAANLRGGI